MYADDWLVKIMILGSTSLESVLLLPNYKNTTKNLNQMKLKISYQQLAVYTEFVNPCF